MIKILDLFSGTQSVKKAFPNSDYKGIDIYKGDGNLILDLTGDDIVEKTIKLLGENGKPDFIGASPVCNKFSRATTGKGGNTYFVVSNGRIRVRSAWEYYFVKHNKYNEKPEKGNIFVSEAKLALKMYQNMIKIINHYNVPFAIENPRSALSQYVLSDYNKNFCDYCMYGFDYKKPTTIYSDVKFTMKICNHKKHVKTIEQSVGKYSDRSKVPPNLIKEVVKKILKQDI